VLRRIGAVLIALPLVYLLAGTLGGLIRTGGDATGSGPSVYLLPGPIHTDFVVPLTPQVRSAFVFLHEAGMPVDRAEALILGWGSEAFYTQTGTYTDVKFANIWTAATGDSAVMRVALIGPGADLSGLTEVGLGPDQFTRLVAEIAESFAAPTPLPIDGLSAGDMFFPATGRFDLFRTCNVWVGKILRQSGVRVGVWTPFTWSLP